MEKISVFGLGRVGLVMAVALAKHGYDVAGIDIDQSVIDKLLRGESPFYEKDLSEYLPTILAAKKFTATRDSKVNSNRDLAYLAVGTPSRQDGSIDLGYVKQAAGAIGRSIRDSNRKQIVIIKSTVLPGTARNIVKPILEQESGKRAGTDFFLCSNPEFLREGSALRDTEFPDRIIIGSDDRSATGKLEAFYARFHRGKKPAVITTSFESAELIKYANNAFLATKISFINAIAGIAEATPHADVAMIARGIGVDERIAPKFLNAGLGWGGSCFPKDLAALLDYAKGLGDDLKLIESVVSSNKRQAEKAAEFAKKALGVLTNKQIAILGVAFKPGTDDLRDAVSIQAITKLLDSGAIVKVWDPQALDEAKALFGERVGYAKNALDCIHGADCCILVTEWPEFKKLDPEVFLKHMSRPVVIDGRRLFDAEKFRAEGIHFQAIGLGPSQ